MNIIIVIILAPVYLAVCGVAVLFASSLIGTIVSHFKTPTKDDIKRAVW
jgi:hypothetical protein